MFLNVKKSQISKVLPENINIQKKDFWKYYLTFLTLEKGEFISKSEIEVLSSVLCRDLNVSWFSRPKEEEIMQECNIKPANFRRIVYQLRDKNFIVSTEIRGDFLLCDALAKQKRQIEDLLSKSTEIKFIFPFNIES
jgi:hypothetical protein